MKNLFYLSIICVGLISCNKNLNNGTVNSEQDNNISSYGVGDDKDEHGCIGSAGYVWSVLKNKCVRLFEIGYRLNPTVIAPDEAIISAFVIFNDNKTDLELFLPNIEESIILKQKNDSIYESDEYTFNSNGFVLSQNGEKIYEAASTELKNINDFNDDPED